MPTIFRGNTPIRWKCPIGFQIVWGIGLAINFYFPFLHKSFLLSPWKFTEVNEGKK